MSAYTNLAAWTKGHPDYSWEDNFEFRREALRIADQRGMRVAAIVILTNWLSVHVEQRQPFARELLEDIRKRIALLSSIQHKNSTDVQQALANLNGYEARILLREAQGDGPVEAASKVGRARELFAEAVDRRKAVPHNRTNAQVAWADAMLEAYCADANLSTQEVEEPLERALRSLDSHACDLCRGYYHHTRARLLDLLAQRAFNEDRSAALRNWTAAREETRRASTCYSRTGHQNLRFVGELFRTIEEAIAVNERPHRVFLSHKSADKELVRRVHAALRELGFDPWLDDDAMPAGALTERALVDGIEQSCAAAFFVTSRFADEGFIATEIEHALHEQRNRPDLFKIIVIEMGPGAMTPRLLSRFIHKRCDTELEAFTEIIRALPVKVGTVHW
nr:TIR domain-containing protein [Deltaproteobacteria bacterium]